MVIEADKHARLIALNSDHNRRMIELVGVHERMGVTQKLAEKDGQSREALVQAMLGCRNRFHMQSVHPALLELGASDGHEREFLTSWLDLDTYTGVEVVPEKVGPGVLCMAVEDMPYENAFDYVYSRHVLEHTYPDPALEAISRALKPHGIVGSVTPWGKDNEPAHISQLSMSEWTEVYARHGLRVVYAVKGSYWGEELHLVAIKADWPIEGL